MDFEIEDDGDDYNYDWNDNKKASTIKKKSASFFGNTSSNDNDEDVYQYSFEQQQNKSGSSRNSYNSFTKIESKPIVTDKLNSNSISQSQNNNFDAMDRAKQMLDKYSNKAFIKPNQTNNKSSRVKTFNEDAISISSNDNDEDNFQEDSSDTSTNNFKSKTSLQKKKSASRNNINDLGSKALVTVSMMDEDDDDDDMKYNHNIIKKDIKIDENRFKLIKERQESDHTEFTKYTVGIDTDDDDDEVDNARNKNHHQQQGNDNNDDDGYSNSSVNEYSEDQFDQHYDDDDDDDVNNNPIITDDVNNSTRSYPSEVMDEDLLRHNDITTISGYDNNNNNNNMSYSRLAYGVEDDIDSDDVDEEANNTTQTSKPKIMSFADFDIPTWDIIPETATNDDVSNSMGADNGNTQPIGADNASHSIINKSTIETNNKTIAHTNSSIEVASAVSKVVDGVKKEHNIVPKRSETPPRHNIINSHSDIDINNIIPKEINNSNPVIQVPMMNHPSQQQQQPYPVIHSIPPVIHNEHSTSYNNISYNTNPQQQQQIIPQIAVQVQHLQSDCNTNNTNTIIPPPQSNIIFTQYPHHHHSYQDHPLNVAPTSYPNNQPPASSMYPATTMPQFNPLSASIPSTGSQVYYPPPPYYYPPAMPYPMYSYYPPPQPPSTHNQVPPIPSSHTHPSLPLSMYGNHIPHPSQSLPNGFHFQQPQALLLPPPQQQPQQSYPDPRAQHLSASYDPYHSSYAHTTYTAPNIPNNGVFTRNSLSLNQSNTNIIQQPPLVLNLLQELQQAKEEADWMKHKLAVTLIKLNEQQQQQQSNNVVEGGGDDRLESKQKKDVLINRYSTRNNENQHQDKMKISLSPSNKGKKNVFVSINNDDLSSPLKSMLQSPVLPLKSSLRTTTTYNNNNNNNNNNRGTTTTTASTTSKASMLEDSSTLFSDEGFGGVGGGNNIIISNIAINTNNNDDVVVDEDIEDDGPNDDEYEYSSDFESINKSSMNIPPSTSPISYLSNHNSPIHSHNNNNHKNNNHKNNNNNNNNVTNNTATLSKHIEHSSSSIPSKTECDTTLKHYVSITNRLKDREKVMNPLQENLANSLLNSQELFKNQLESLRMRIEMTNSYTNTMNMRMNDQWDDIKIKYNMKNNIDNNISITNNKTIDPSLYLSSTYEPKPTLKDIKAEFNTKRIQNTEKLLDLLMQIYPTMSKEEAYKLAMKI